MVFAGWPDYLAMMIVHIICICESLFHQITTLQRNYRELNDEYGA